MALPHCGANAFLEFTERPWGESLAWEQGRVQLFGGVPSRSTHNDVVALFLPFQYGTRGETQFAANFSRY
jgi:hypothetical protein